MYPGNFHTKEEAFLATKKLEILFTSMFSEIEPNCRLFDI